MNVKSLNCSSLAEELLHDPECFSDLLQFYDGLCSWEEDSATPVLHIGWVKPMVKTFSSFDFSIRTKIGIKVESGEGEGGGNDEILSFGEHQGLQRVPDSVNNNYKMSVDDLCDDMNCDKNLLRHSIYEFENYFLNEENFLKSENFESMTVNKLLKVVNSIECEPSTSIQKTVFMNNLIKGSGEKVLNIECLLGKNISQPFLDVESLCNLESYCQSESELTNPPDDILEKTKEDSRKAPGKRLNLTLHSVKMAALKDILQAEKMNSSALHLQLTAQNQTQTKKQRNSLETDGRAKRIRRE